MTNVSGSDSARVERGVEGGASRRVGETGRSRARARGGDRNCFGGHPHLLAKSGNTGHVLNVVQDAGAERGLSERVHGGEDRGVGTHGDLLEPGGLLGGVRLAQVAALAVSGGLTGSAALVGRESGKREISGKPRWWCRRETGGGAVVEGKERMGCRAPLLVARGGEAERRGRPRGERGERGGLRVADALGQQCPRRRDGRERVGEEQEG